jgi:integration host factor subunit alpha
MTSTEILSEQESSSLTRTDLAAALYEQVGMSYNEALDIVETILATMREEGIAALGGVKIPGFGSFVVRKKQARLGRNPKTKEAATISARNIISFYPSIQLKSLVNHESK